MIAAFLEPARATTHTHVVGQPENARPKVFTSPNVSASHIQTFVLLWDKRKR